MLVTTIFLIFPTMFLPYQRQKLSFWQNLLSANTFNSENSTGLLCSRLYSFPNKPWFLCVCSTCLLKTLCEKGKLLITSNSPFPTAFSTFLENLGNCHQIWNCDLLTLSVWKSVKFVVWERVNKRAAYLSFCLDGNLDLKMYLMMHKIW